MILEVIGMKKFLLLTGMTSLLLSSCVFNLLPGPKFAKKTARFYSTVDFAFASMDYATPEKAETKAYIGDINFKIHPKYKNILYTDFRTYCTLLAKTLPENYTYALNGYEFLVQNDKKEPLFAAMVDTGNERFVYSGGLSLGSYGGGAVAMASTLLADLKIDQGYEVLPTYTTSSISYANFAQDLPVYDWGNAFVAPLGLFDAAFGDAVSAYHIYDGNRVVQYNTSLVTLIPIGEAGSLSTTLGEFYKQNGMTYDMRLLDKACLYLAMENRYGLRDFKRIPSMSKYFDMLGFSKSLVAEDPAERTNAYFDLFAALDDDHTGLNSVATWFGEDAKLNHRSQRSNDRNALNKSLIEQRNNVLGTTRTPYGIDETVHYSTSGKTAYFYFDGFNFDPTPYNESIRNDLWHRDTYFYFLHQLQEIENHGGVERVIIDDSCNGGGTIGIAIKLLALLSQENYASIMTYDLNSKGVTRLAGSLDSNQDTKYDKDDVFGDDFEFSIITSPSSFSCGNLFPIFAQRHFNATIIGQTSGGGECSVGSFFLPSGKEIKHSSNEIICDYIDEKVVRGVELGATPDIVIPYYDFYNIDLLEQKLIEQNSID